MKKHFALPIISLAVVGLVAMSATTAFAVPTKTVPCTGCHSGANVAVTATLASPAGATATYNFSAPSASAVAVFDGATKLFTFNATSGQFTVASGKTYTLFAVTGPGTGDGVGSTTVSPATPPTDTFAPVTTSDAKATYVSSAAIKLTATDAGSGVATTYYKLDGGLQTAGTAINVTALGAHTIEFWSVDVAGNAELHKTAAFTITAPTTVDTLAPVTTSDAKATYVTSAAVKLTATDAGSGVATTHYKLDGGLQTAGTAINVTALGAHTIEFWSVDVAGNAELHKTAAFTLTATVPPVVTDTLAPVTTSDALSTYMWGAAIKLTATDAGSGVANTYYKLDGGAQNAGIWVSVSTLGTHTVEFWSVDASGNAELHKNAAFTITAPVAPPAPSPRMVKVYVKVPKGRSKGLTAVLTDAATGATFKARIGKRGNAKFTSIPAGSYSLTVKGKKVKFNARTVVVGDLDMSVSGMRVSFRR